MPKVYALISFFIQNKIFLRHWKDLDFSMGQNQQIQAQEETLDVNIQDLYRSFIMECPSGSLYLHEFKRLFGVRCGTPESEYMDNIFRAFDMNHDNTMDFIEYVAALNLVLRGKLEDKLRWSFKVFDSDNNERLDRSELRKIVEIIYKIKKGLVYDESGTEKLTVSQVCDRIFAEVDANSDGEITLDEFVQGSQRNPWLQTFLRLDVDPSAWVQRYLCDRKLLNAKDS